MRYIIIDGYNLIFQCGLEGRHKDDRALERSRDRLFRELARRLPDDVRKQTTIVFDSESRPAGVNSDRFEIKDMTVLFAVGYPDADTLIIELIRKHPVPGSLTVVSSDHLIQKSSRARRANPVDSDIWFDSLSAASRGNNEIVESDSLDTEREKPGLSREETGALIDEFSSVRIQLDEDPIEPLSDEDRETDQQAAEKEADFEEGFDPFPDGWFDDLDQTI
ncbi:MAG: NYN domain-containing protein [Planctomycetota bacterium]